MLNCDVSTALVSSPSARLTTTRTRQSRVKISPILFLSQQTQSEELPVKIPVASPPEDMLLQQRTAVLVLFTVPFAWGTFEPAARFVYSLDPPVPGFLYSLAYYFVATISLLIANTISLSRRLETSSLPSLVKTTNAASSWLGGIELGLYLFMGNALQILGLKTVPSDRAAFLLQMTTLIVPLLEATFAGKWSAVSSRTWLSCAIALTGVFVMGLDGADVSETTPVADDITALLSSVSLSTGDFLVLAAAVAYSFHCIRLEKYAKTTAATTLALSKALTETVCSAITVLALVGYCSSFTQFSAPPSSNTLTSFARETGNEIVQYTTYLGSSFLEGTLTLSTIGPALAVILWTGMIGVAYTISAQTYGQSQVRPATANLIYTIQPICTALFAWALLGETLGPAGYLGGGLIGMAVLLVVTANTEASVKLKSDEENY